MQGNLEKLFDRCWEMKVKFDKRNNPIELKMVFKSTTETSAGFKKDLRKLVKDFIANAEKDGPDEC